MAAVLDCIWIFPINLCKRVDFFPLSKCRNVLQEHGTEYYGQLCRPFAIWKIAIIHSRKRRFREEKQNGGKGDSAAQFSTWPLDSDDSNPFFSHFFTRAWYGIFQSFHSWNLNIEMVKLVEEMGFYANFHHFPGVVWWCTRQKRTVRPIVHFQGRLMIKLLIFSEMFYKSMVGNIAKNPLLPFELQNGGNWWWKRAFETQENGGEDVLWAHHFHFWSWMTAEWINFANMFYKSMIRKIADISLGQLESR